MSAALATRVPVSVNTFGSVTVLWEGCGNYQRIPYGFGYLWQLTAAPEGSVDTLWLALPCDVLESSWSAGPGFVRARGY